MARPFGILVGTFLTFLFGVWTFQLVSTTGSRESSGASVSRPYQLPNDDFDQRTMDAIRAAIAQYQVAMTPHDHEVYVVTGGLGEANPRLAAFDSEGNMTFSRLTPDHATMDIRETRRSPANWQMQHQGTGIMVAEDPSGPMQGFSPVPWVHKTTSTGMDYFEWREFPTTSVYYFQKGKTYVILTVDSEGTLGFPEGIVHHLEPIGNPVCDS